MHVIHAEQGERIGELEIGHGRPDEQWGTLSAS
jgi:hypothetical protein